jgi:hypothetical protein
MACEDCELGRLRRALAIQERKAAEAQAALEEALAFGVVQAEKIEKLERLVETLTLKKIAHDS